MEAALLELRTKPSVSLETWGKANQIGRNTQYKLAAKGQIEGLYKVGHQYRVASAPWRKLLGIEPVEST
jgi:predicted site-specific integrase-resolvase